tara:strand:+ start:1168 stop:1434 length:267 start_codon:yes stop_codon:yes gene_type:complete
MYLRSGQIKAQQDAGDRYQHLDRNIKGPRIAQGGEQTTIRMQPIIKNLEPALAFLEERVRMPYFNGTWIDRRLFRPLKEAYVQGTKKE